MVRTVLLTLTLTACQPGEVVLGDFIVGLDRELGTLDVSHAVRGPLLEGARLGAGRGSAEITMLAGAYLFEDEEQELVQAAGFGAVQGDEETLWFVTVEDSAGEPLGMLGLDAAGDDLVLSWEPEDAGANRMTLSAACVPGEPFMGLGGHAQDVEHSGEAFPLWVSEPGIGKTDSDDPPDDWFYTGTRHASSYPVPFLLRPEADHGLLAATTARVEVDLCAEDPDRFQVTTWDQGAAVFVLVSGSDPVEVVEGLSEYTGRPALPPGWAFAPWNDAVHGSERVREVADALRGSGAASSVIWSEDWKGGFENATGYHLEGEWFLDEELYPDAPALAGELEERGFKWFAYFSPFLFEETETWQDALDAGVIIKDPQGEPYVFTGATLEPTSLVDLSTRAGRDWAVSKMEAALELGFDGWMADFAEWLPTDARLASGEDALLAHNAYPAWWQETNLLAQAGWDATFFARSGWAGTAGLAPIVWGGDQRTSFEADDGFPTVVALGLGLAASGVPIFTHDIAGYQSVGNPPSDKELWYRWAALGAFSPVMRTHHGAFGDENWQFDTDEETLAYWASLTREHMRLHPYRYGLAARAAERGTPMLLPTGFLFEGEDWGRADAWMLGEALLVAPVLEAGADGREVDLPGGVEWYDWWTLAPASGGWADAPLSDDPAEIIPVYAASGTTVPTFARVPNTLVPTDEPGVLDLEDVDGERVVYLFGGGGTFTEADGTCYRPSGAPTGAGEVTATLTSGEVEVAGVTVTVEGAVERTYTFVIP